MQSFLLLLCWRRLDLNFQLVLVLALRTSPSQGSRLGLNSRLVSTLFHGCAWQDLHFNLPNHCTGQSSRADYSHGIQLVLQHQDALFEFSLFITDIERLFAWAHRSHLQGLSPQKKSFIRFQPEEGACFLCLSAMIPCKERLGLSLEVDSKAYYRRLPFAPRFHTIALP